jgi:uncharacterized protein (TIGR02646 family)
MIRLAKHEKPAILAANEEAWTTEYLAHWAGGRTPPEPARYRHPNIKTAIQRETFEKCAYCESKVPHTYFGDVEHILPKSRVPELVVQWDNLTFVCAQCNNKKRDYYDPGDPLVDPYTDDPEEHLRFYGPVCFEIAGNAKGRATVINLGLSRGSLVERRTDRLEKIQHMLRQWAALPVGQTRDAWADQIREEACQSREYTAAVRTFLREAGFPLDS